MSKRTPKTPSYRRLKDKRRGDRAFVEFNGKRHYLGKYGTDESRQAYDRIIAEWLASGRHVRPDVSEHEITITELIAAYWCHAERYYVKPDGEKTSSLGRIKFVSRILKGLYGDTRAVDFGPKTLKAVRGTWVDKGWCRNVCNGYTSIIKQMFKWAVAEELIPPATSQALQAVANLSRGRTEAVDHEPIKPVPKSDIDAIEPFVSAEVWTLIQMQLLTGTRAGEWLIARPIDLDMSDDVWVYKPADHKTAHHGHERRIYVGPQAQDLIRPFLVNRPTNARLFSTRTRGGEVTEPIDHSLHRYRRAIARGCDDAGVPRWNPQRLRHNYATQVRKDHGLEMAQILLGHTKADVTQIYAEPDIAKAVAVALKIG